MVFERKKIFPSSSPSLSFWKVSISTSQRLESILEATSFEGLNDPTLCSEKKLSSGRQIVLGMEVSVVEIYR